jgi:hypothetical protein
LIVIHAERRIELLTCFGMEHRVRRQGPDGLDAFLVKLRDSWSDDRLVFLAQGPLFACMGVEPSNGQARRIDAKAVFKVPRHDLADFNDALRRQ